MRYNLLFPMRAVKHYHRWIGDNDLGDVAKVAEDAGFDAISLTEHPFPETEWAAIGHHAFDPIVGLASMASRTERIKLVTYALVASYRHPFMMAKSLGTLDALSRGRVVAGLVAGYLRPEFDVLGASFEARGKYLNEAIPAMRAAWSGGDHVGELFTAEGHSMLPLPTQPGGPPIWLGGNGQAAMRRAVECGDGWMPFALSGEVAEQTGAPPVANLDQLGALVADVQLRRQEQGRESLDIVFAPFESELLKLDTPDMFCQAVIEEFPAYESAGVGWLTIEPRSRSFEQFRKDVLRISELLITQTNH